MLQAQIIKSNYTEKRKLLSEFFDWNYNVINVEALYIDETETDYELMRKISIIEIQKLIEITTNIGLN